MFRRRFPQNRVTHLDVSVVTVSLERARTPAHTQTVSRHSSSVSERSSSQGLRDQRYLLFLLLFLFSSSFCAEFRLSASARLSTAMAKKTFSKMSDQMC